MSNLVVFPPKGNEPTFDERLADLKASAGPTPIVSPDAKNKVAKAGPTEAENKEQHVSIERSHLLTISLIPQYSRKTSKSHPHTDSLTLSTFSGRN